MSRNERIVTFEIAGVAVWIEQSPPDSLGDRCYLALCRVHYQDRYLGSDLALWPHVKAHNSSISIAAAKLAAQLLDTAGTVEAATLGCDVQNEQAIGTLRALSEGLHLWARNEGAQLDREVAA